MRPWHHVTISFIAGLIYLLLTDKVFYWPNLAPWIIGGLALDIDHLFMYSAKKKTLNIKKILRIMNEDYKINNQHFYPFHTLEATLFIAFLVTKTSLTWPFLASYLLHLFCDGLRLKKMKKDYSWLKKWSFAYYVRAFRR